MLRPLRRLLPLLLLSPLIGHADTDPRAARLAALRAEVEALHQELDVEKESLRGELRAINAQRVDLEVQVRREELRLERLLSAEAELRAAQLPTAGDALRGILVGNIDALRAHVDEGLPFRATERAAALTELRAQLDDGRKTPEQVAARLWAFVEDERRLGRTTGLDRQVITVDGQELLADIARLGMVALYWRAPDGRVGLAARGGAGWTFRPMDAEEDRVAALALFDALERGIHTGTFTLPLAGGAR
ncbi:MAG: hypothetical protein RL071_3563 [Pseudomonadota bacterium]